MSDGDDDAIFWRKVTRELLRIGLFCKLFLIADSRAMVAYFPIFYVCVCVCGGVGVFVRVKMDYTVYSVQIGSPLRCCYN